MKASFGRGADPFISLKYVVSYDVKMAMSVSLRVHPLFFDI